MLNFKPEKHFVSKKILHLVKETLLINQKINVDIFNNARVSSLRETLTRPANAYIYISTLVMFTYISIYIRVYTLGYMYT